MSNTSEQLQWEASTGKKAAIAGVAASILPLIASISVPLLFTESPNNSPAAVIFKHDHGPELIGLVALWGLGTLSMIPVFLYLYRLIKARRPAMPRVAEICAVFGPASLALTQVAVQMILVNDAGPFMDTAKTYEEAQDVLKSDTVQVVSAIGQAGALALGFGMVMLSLNAMRVGLLTRFMGILGIIGGVLFVIPLGTPIPIIQCFWLGALAYLFSGRWPGGRPPSWKTGKAEPWPTMQQQREAVAAAKDPDNSDK